MFTMIYNSSGDFLTCESHMSACVSRGEKRFYVYMYACTHAHVHHRHHLVAFKEMKKENKFEKHE